MQASQFLFDPVVLHGVSAALSIILILGGLSKLRDIELFRYAVENYRLLPAPTVLPFAWGFALAELLAGLGLVVEPLQFWAALLGLGVMAVATGGVAISLRRGLDRIECGCGSGGQRISWGLVGRNAVLAAAIALCAGDEAARPLAAFDYFSVAAIALALLALYACANQLLANQPFLKEIHS